MDSPDLSPGSSPWDTNRTNRTRSSGGKYESALFLRPAQKVYIGFKNDVTTDTTDTNDPMRPGSNILSQSS